ncbi:hypothetical protein BH23GEM9_BH23GEM9_00280 [soil metagenome]
MTRSGSKLTRRFIIFLAAGVAWTGLTRVTPEGISNDGVAVVFGFGFAAAFLALLVCRVRSLLGEKGSVAVQLGLMLMDVVIMVCTFALVYSMTGLLDNTTPDLTTVYSFPLSLYYSVVTFTTLGYGDFYPTGSGRVLAAAEAAIGYVVLGIVVSTAARLLSPHSPAGGMMDQQEGGGG